MTLGGGPLGEERLPTVHILWWVFKKVTVIGIECNGAVFFNVISRRSTPEIVLSRIFFQNSASKMAKSIIVDIVNSLMLLTGKLLATHS